MSTEEEHGVALKKGAMLNEYRLDGVLGVGGFGVTYLALDTHLDKKVVIKEFLPNEIAIRQEGTTVLPKSSSDKEGFEWGLDRFLQEAKVLAKFNHPNIVKVSRFFKENGTAYFVMDYEEGEDLESYIKQRGGTLEEDEIKQIMLPILDGLREVHSHDFLHRDIKPGNIYIRKNGSPMLIDFGASRYALSSKSKSLTQMLTPGYAPIEQYSSDASKQGAYTDIYAIGAVMYKMISAQTPAESQDRSNAMVEGEDSPYVPIEEVSQGSYTSALYKSIDTSLELSAKKRPQNVKELQKLMMEGSQTPTPPPEEKPKDEKPQEKPAQPEAVKEEVEDVKKEEESDKEKKNNNGIKIVVAVVIVILVSVFAVNLYQTMEIEKQEQARLLKAEKLKAKQAQEKLAQRLAEEKRKKDEAAKYRTITIRSNVSNDVVKINGINKGSTPVEIRKKIGETLNIEIKKEGYVSAKKKVKVKTNKVFKLQLKKVKEVKALDGYDYFKLGQKYWKGEGASQDYSKSIKYYRKGAALGNKGCMTMIGMQYEYGDGVSKSRSKAIEWYRKAAKLGQPTAQDKLTKWGETWQSDTESAGSKKARKLLREKDYFWLAFMYKDGDEIPQDYAKAMKYFIKGAELGGAACMHMVGSMYQYGDGVNRDRDMAIKWYRKAAKAGYTQSQERLTEWGKSW